MAIYDKHNSDLQAAKKALAKAEVPAKEKAELVKTVDAIETDFVKAIALAKSYKKMNDQANELKKKHDDFVAKMPDQTPFIKLVDKLNTNSGAARKIATKLSAEAAKKNDKAAGKALDQTGDALGAIYADTGSFFR